MRFAPGTSKEKAKTKNSKAFLKKKADQVAGRDRAKPPVKKEEEGVTKKVVEAKAPAKVKKEAVLADARKKIGASEEKRADFKKRSAETRAKREEKRKATKESGAPANTNPAQAPAATPATSPIRRPNRSVMVQRVNQQMANTGATREEARGQVVARRDARQQQLEKIQSEQGVGRRQARGIMKYGNKTAVVPEGGGPAVANYQLAKRVVQMAKNKGLSREEAAKVISGRRDARKAANSPTTPAV